MRKITEASKPRVDRYPASARRPLEPKGVYFFPSGNHYVGPLHNGRPHGWGRLCFRICEPAHPGLEDAIEYEGEFRHGREHGCGILRFSGGTYIAGTFCDGQIDGYARTETRFLSYRGHYRGNKPNGFGVSVRKDRSERYQGLFRDGFYWGFGILWMPDGRRYEGMFRGGVFNGYGRLVFPDGKQLIGRFEGGRFVAPCKS